MQDESAANVNNVSGLLKAFVILGGVMLLIGMIILAVMIILRSGGPPEGGLAFSGTADLALPSGVRVSQVVVEGKRLVLLGEGPDGRQYIAVVDADSGERKSLIRVTAEE
ncbi:MAG: hypothetical protein R3F54_11575 [Alphaproteobacteria bacterium]